MSTTAEAEAVVADWLGTVLGRPAASYTDVDKSASRVEVYLDEKPRWGCQQRRELAAGLKALAGGGLEVGPARVRLSRVRAEQWAESWKRHFRALEITRALLIKPGWSRKQRRKGQAVVVLDPGLSFGTGHHPTTAFCLRQLVRLRRRGEAQSFLDIGTGSGILAIAAARLGCGPVRAFDSDAEAVRAARANARRNRVRHKIVFRRHDLTQLPWRGGQRYSVVCANLTSDLLLSQRRRITAQLVAGGTLVLAGILQSEFARVRRAYEAEGLQLTASRTEKEWRSGAFEWPEAQALRNKSHTGIPACLTRCGG